eukprot:2266897-Pyramimonas_sp.AAC.1
MWCLEVSRGVPVRSIVRSSAPRLQPRTHGGPSGRKELLGRAQEPKGSGFRGGKNPWRGFEHG